MASNTLLIELGVEELPPGAIDTLSDAFAANIAEGLRKAEVGFDQVRAYATPRRLAVQISALEDKQPDREIERRGPALGAAFKDGEPTKAAMGFARSCGVDVDQLMQLETDKGTWLGYRFTQSGEPVTALLPDIITKAVADLPVPKYMRWGASRIEFSRPVHWLVVLYGRDVVEARVLDLDAGRNTRGHRFHAPAPIELVHAEDYLEALEGAYVLADREQRRERIRQQVLARAEVLNATAVIDEALLVEVSGLVEWPVALAGSFDVRFLEVPAQCLVSSMKANQKYFHLLDESGRLKPAFITISNIESRDPRQVVEGNEKVIRPRLADAAFFYEADLGRSLASRRDGLANVTFQHQLGSLADKSDRIEVLARAIVQRIDGNSEHAGRAAQLAKCDLVTEMVQEFPELQGTMGYYYARHDGEPDAVAQALQEQYLPRFASDQIPQTATGQALALADRLDTLVGIFGIGQRPSGTKDPFALRRAAIGVLNILIKAELDLDLRELLQQTAAQHQALPKAEGVVDEVLDYMLDRFRAWTQDEGIAVEVYLAVRARPVTRPLDFARRVRAVNAFSQREEATALAAANKRVSNILAKQEYDHESIIRVDEQLLQEPAERALEKALEERRELTAPLLADARYREALDALAALREPVDIFFDDVMVMTENAAVRNNRLALLAKLQGLFLEVADISQLQ
ncbi:glycine--tRNA ligase subunit beta [Halomonas sp. PR-M31]|uniref:glycine--tRNA ligase subunit beta n=1 Tax=Halomonas sp. PR-M31 TaxID=1471202 RepID=UPI000651DC72|nr:glycine--tRNA ligase subunit beta [Halomonas sp. PR-M31]